MIKRLNGDEMMEQEEIIQALNKQAKADYLCWCDGREPEGPDFDSDIFQDLSIQSLLIVLDRVSSKKPIEVDYGAIYCACVLGKSFTYLQKKMDASPVVGLDGLTILLRFARIFLNVGDYAKCIDCCNFCLKEQNVFQLPLELQVEVLFTRAKAQRNLGEYQYALEDLRNAIHIVDKNDTISFLMGAVLLRIGKVYSQFLMMMSVSLCFLNEAKARLEPWLDEADSRIRTRANKEYAICLDSIGQYWQGKGDQEEAIFWFLKAEKINKDLDRTPGIFRTRSHIIITAYPELLHKPERSDELEQMTQELQYIVRKLEDDHVNQRGLAVRLLHLSELQARRGRIIDALYSLEKSREMARLYRDDKTQIKQKIVELKYGVFKGVINKKDLLTIIELAKRRKYYGYEINLHEAVIEAIDLGYLSNELKLNSLSRSRSLYLQLSNIAQEAINRVSRISDQSKDEFSYLSETNGKELLVKVVNDYDLFIQKMNKIIVQLLQITEQRSKDLNKAILAEAKASLASNILHDLKHILVSTEGQTYLDTVLEKLKYDYPELSQEKRDQLINYIQMVNQSLKKKIIPQIKDATRVPNDFNREINVLDIFSEVCQWGQEEYTNILSLNEKKVDSEELALAPVEILCPDDLTIVYNRQSFLNLIKEMYRNVLDYQWKNQVGVKKNIMEAKDQDGEVEIQILTQFMYEECALQAAKAIADQLNEENGLEDGFGIRALRGFVQFKTGGACTATVAKSMDQVGIRFTVPRK